MITRLRRLIQGFSRVAGLGAAVAVLATMIGLVAGCSDWDVERIGADGIYVFFYVLFGLWPDHSPVPLASPTFPVPAKIATAPVAQSGATLYLGAAAHVAGAADTDWRSDCEVLCVGPDDCAFTIEALMHGQANPTPASRSYTLAAGHAMLLGDVLLAEFGRDGKAALRLVPTAGAVVATDRTYNLLAAGNGLGLPAGATFGQYIPAVRAGAAITTGDEGRLIQLQHTVSGGGFRTNLGLVNVTGVATVVKVDLYRANGVKLGTVSRNLAPYEYRQIGNVFDGVTSGDVEDGYAVVSTSTDGAAFLAQASVVDNATGDPVFVPAQRRRGGGTKRVQAPQFIAAAAHIRGAADTNWRTDVELHNAADAPAQVTLELLEHGKDNSTPRAETVTVAAGSSRRFEDVLENLFDFSGKAALRVTADGGEIVVSSRTYNLIGAKAAASLPPGATFGQFIPAAGETDTIHRGDTGLLIQLAQSANDTTGFRANLALVNARTSPTTVDVEALAADGATLGSFQVPLKPLEYRQLNSVFREVTAAAVADGYLKLSTATDDGAFFALASVVDNATGDPVGMMHARVVADGAQSFVEGAAALFDVLGGTVGADGELVGLPELVATLRDVGVDSLLLEAASELPVATVANGVLTADYGAGWVDPSGSVHTGVMELDLSGLTITSSQVTGSIIDRHLDHLIDGEAPILGVIEADLDLTVDAQGEVRGTIDVSGGPASALVKTGGTAALSGTIEIDTLLCRYFPTGGSVTFSLGDSSTTISFTPACDGAFDYSSDPRWDWLYQARDPEDADSQTYVHSTSNVIIRTEGQFRFWQPEAGGQTFDATTPGTVVYRFPFDRPVLAAQGGFSVYTFHWSYSQGRGYVYGSRNGSAWVLLDQIEPPAEGGWNRGGSGLVVPPALLGGTELWFKVELYSWGPSAPNGGALTNTAQLCRYDISRDPVTAWLQVDLE